MKYCIVTFGCRVNQSDSLRIEEQLIAAGGIAVPPAEADLVVVNTCSVTAAADQGTRQIIRKIARTNPHARIVATGCYATRQPSEIEGLAAGVRVVPNDLKDRLADEIGLTTAVRFGDGDGACGAQISPGIAGRTAYTLRVQTGCDQTCSYCIIPSTRGRGRSKPFEEVLSEIGRLHHAGYREIVLTGVHLGSYGRDLVNRSSLVELLQRIERRAYDVRFRISSLEPMDCTDEIVDLVARSACFAPHFHLPLQHASDRILEKMQRPYTLDSYQRLVNRIRREIPHAAIGSDIIVGFPGETDDDFARLESFLPHSPLTHLHVFPYSDRPGTVAAGLREKVDGNIVRDRARRIRAIGEALTVTFHRAQYGTVRPGLTVEDGSLVVTDNYLKLRVEPGLSRNEWVQVEIAAGGNSHECRGLLRW